MERALTKLCNYINNFFERDVVTGRFTIENCAINAPFLADGQYFRIYGSVQNDGIYQYPAYDLKDEEFDGMISGLAIPAEIVELAADIEAYEASPENAPKAYTSESFGGYSYSRGTDSNGAPASWQTVFRKRLNRWRKVW